MLILWSFVFTTPVRRTLGYLGGNVWTHSVNEPKAVVDVHLYTAATLRLRVIEITQKTQWPWSRDVYFIIHTKGPPVDLQLRLRIPEWTQS